jgi:hypothetical protein
VIEIWRMMGNEAREVECHVFSEHGAGLAAKNASLLQEAKMLSAARKELLEEPHLAQVQGRHLRPESWHRTTVLQR